MSWRWSFSPDHVHRKLAYCSVSTKWYMCCSQDIHYYFKQKHTFIVDHLFTTDGKSIFISQRYLVLENVSQATQPEYHSSVSDRISFIRSLTTAFFPLMTVVCLIFLSTTSPELCQRRTKRFDFLAMVGFQGIE